MVRADAAHRPRCRRTVGPRKASVLLSLLNCGPGGVLPFDGGSRFSGWWGELGGRLHGWNRGGLGAPTLGVLRSHRLFPLVEHSVHGSRQHGRAVLLDLKVSGKSRCHDYSRGLRCGYKANVGTTGDPFGGSSSTRRQSCAARERAIEGKERGGNASLRSVSALTPRYTAQGAAAPRDSW